MVAGGTMTVLTRATITSHLSVMCGPTSIGLVSGASLVRVAHIIVLTASLSIKHFIVTSSVVIDVTTSTPLCIYNARAGICEGVASITAISVGTITSMLARP